ncbi:MAG: zinc-ribbon domain-containing protein, partial [Thermoproteota archaeon]
SETRSDGKFCSECGTTLSKTAKFCPECGTTQD